MIYIVHTLKNKYTYLSLKSASEEIEYQTKLGVCCWLQMDDFLK